MGDALEASLEWNKLLESELQRMKENQCIAAEAYQELYSAIRKTSFVLSLASIKETSAETGEVSEGWLGCTDADDDSPGGWAR